VNDGSTVEDVTRSPRERRLGPVGRCALRGIWVKHVGDVRRVGMQRRRLPDGDVMELRRTRSFCRRTFISGTAHQPRSGVRAARPVRQSCSGVEGGAGARARCAWFHELDLALALMQSDDAAATREIAWFQGREDECLNLDLQASRALVLGQRRRASALLREAASQGSRRKLEGPPTP
jgi:hypothetical protein